MRSWLLSKCSGQKKLLASSDPQRTEKTACIVRPAAHSGGEKRSLTSTGEGEGHVGAREADYKRGSRREDREQRNRFILMKMIEISLFYISRTYPATRAHSTLLWPAAVGSNMLLKVVHVCLAAQDQLDVIRFA